MSVDADCRRNFIPRCTAGNAHGHSLFKILIIIFVGLAESGFGQFVGIRVFRIYAIEAFNYYREAGELAKGNVSRLEYVRNVLSNVPVDSGDNSFAPVLCVVVVGESATRSQLGIYGKNPDTTPFFSGLKQYKKDNFFVFSEAFAANVYTKDVLAEAFSNSCFQSRVEFDKKISLFDICISQDINAALISNQNDLVGEWYQFNRQIKTVFSGTLSKFLTIKGFSTFPDEILLPSIQNELKNFDFKKRNLLVIHLYGSHFPFENRVRDDFMFPVESIEGVADVEAGYVKSVYYTDWILKQIFEAVEKNCSIPYALIYFSDHGENYTGKTYRSIKKEDLCPEILEIPCTVFLSDKYIATFPDKYNALKNNKDKLFCNEFIYNSVIGALNIKSLPPEAYDARQDVFSNKYDIDRNRVKVVRDQFLLEEVLQLPRIR